MNLKEHEKGCFSFSLMDDKYVNKQIKDKKNKKQFSHQI